MMSGESASNSAVYLRMRAMSPDAQYPCGRPAPWPVNSENSKANRIETYERSGGIWTNLFGGSKKNSEENSEK